MKRPSGEKHGKTKSEHQQNSRAWRARPVLILQFAVKKRVVKLFSDEVATSLGLGKCDFKTRP